MPGLKDLRNRIASVDSTRKITRAMQMVAASKLRRAQEAVLAARAYSGLMADLLARAAARAQAGSLPPETRALLLGAPAPPRELLLVATAARGLCGGFNAAITRAARRHAAKAREQGREIAFLCVGKKGAEALKREWEAQIQDVVALPARREDLLPLAQNLARQIIGQAAGQGPAAGRGSATGQGPAAGRGSASGQGPASGRAQTCTFFYSRFESVLVQTPQSLRLLPARPAPAPPAPGPRPLCGYEPDEATLLNALIPRALAQQIFQGLLENAASEQGARMTAMDNATRNANDMIGALSITYNRTRQALITRELVEIISGAEAL